MKLPFFGRSRASANRVRSQAGPEVALYDLSSPEADAFLRSGVMTEAGVAVNDASALRVAAAWRCLHVITGTAGNMPADLMERVDERTRRPAVNHPARALIAFRPNSWQTPQEFKRMMTAHVVLRGNAYALKVTSMGRVIELWPMHPDRVECWQNPDLSLTYRYTRKDGQQVTLPQSEVLHLRGLTLDGVKGLGVLAHARQTLGLALQQQVSASRLFKQGIIGGGALKTDKTLSQEVIDRLKQSLEERNAGAENAHKWLILEEGLQAEELGFSAADIQFLEGRRFERSDIAMFFGVPPHMIGDTTGSTSWGTGIDAQTQGFVTFNAEDYLTMWEEALARDLLQGPDRQRFYFRFNRAALVRGDINARGAFYVRGLQWGWFSPNEVRAMEDLNPRDGGDAFNQPPNTAGDAGGPPDAGNGAANQDKAK